MSASNAQQTVEKKEPVKDVKPMKPPIKPKPIVPPKPKQAFISTNSDIKSPSLSPNSGGPCSPSFDIPSAFKISQLTGPQPYGTRRASLRRWSSSVGEEVPPESNTSPVENAVPELSTKVTTQPLAAPVKSLQTGSVWKGKSPFMLTTRGWGEQKSQVKDFHESESFSQKNSFSSASKDADLKDKVTALEEKTVINSESHSRSKSQVDHEEVNSNVKDLKQSLSRASEEVEKTSYGVMSSGELQKLEIPSQDDEVKESPSQLSGSPQTDLYFGTAKKSTQYEHNKQGSKTEGFSYKSDQVTTGSPENIDVASIQLQNMSLRTKDHEESQLISLVPTTMPKTDILFTENTENAEIIEKISLSDTSGSTVQKVYRYHEDRNNNIPELRSVMGEEQEAASGFLEAPKSEIKVTNQNTEQSSLGKLEQVEKHDISSVTQITDKPATENKMYTNIPHEDKESTVSMEHNILGTAEYFDLHEGELQVASDNNNTPYSDQEDKKIVAPTDMQFPICTVRPYDFFSDGPEKTSRHIHEYNTEEEHDQLKNRIHEYDNTTPTGEYVPHKTSDGFEKQTEYPSEYRSIFGNNTRSTHESETPCASELPGHAHNEASINLYLGSQMLENEKLTPGKDNSHPVNESEESLHSYMKKDTQSSKPQEELLENYESSRPELNYDESQFRYSEVMSHDPAAGVTKPENLSDPYKQSDRFVYTTAHSPILSEGEVHLDEIEHRYDESNKLQYIHSQSQEQECNHGHKVELDDKQSDEPVYTCEQSEGQDYIYQPLEKSVYKFEKSDKPSVLYEQLEVPAELSKEPVCTNEQSEERVSTYKQSEGSGLKNEQTEELGFIPHKVEHPIHKHELLEEPSHRCEKSEETVNEDDQSEDSVHEHKQSDKPVDRYEQTEQLALQQSKTVVHNDHQSEEPEESEEAVQKYGHLKDPINEYKPSETSEHKYVYIEDTVHKYEQLEDPIHKYEQLDESTDNYGQTEQPVQGYQKTEESTHKYEEPVNIYTQSEEIIYSHDQSLEPDYKYKQHDEPAHSYELANQYEGIKDPAHIHTGSDATNTEPTQSGLIDLESHQQQYKPVHLEEVDSTTNIPLVSSEVLVKSSEKDKRPCEYLQQELRGSYMEEPKYSGILPDEMHASEKTEEQFHKYPLSEEHQLLDMHKEEKEETQQWHAKSEGAQHVDGLSEVSRQKLSAITTVESDGSMLEKTQDQDGQIIYQILNGHAEHGELQTVDYAPEEIKEIQAEEPEETQKEEPPAENFDFLEGAVVLDSSFMRGKASLGKKRGHRTPAGTCASEEDPEYWMFRDSTEPKSFPERNSDEEDKGEKSPGGTPDETPDNSPSPVKSPNKKGIFGGIISPSLLKGRLKTRSKTTEDETVRPEAEESKSPGKEKPESSSHSMNWLQALKKKRKSIKEEKKKQTK